MSEVAIVASLAGDFLLDTLARIDAGLDAGELRLYTGTAPATPGGATTETIVCALALQYPCGTIAGRILTLDAPIQGVVIAAGPVGWARVVDAGGTAVFDATAGTTGSGAFVRLPSLSPAVGALLTAEEPVEITA